jgi:outer membrane protein assembly factor BamD (BamD/ComL family)
MSKGRVCSSVLSLFFLFNLIIFNSLIFAGEAEDLEMAKSLYDAKNYNAAKTALQDFMNRYPNSKDFSIAKAFDIKCDYRFANYTMFNQKLDEFKSQYPDHPLMYELDFIKGMSMRRQSQWAESREFFGEYILKYPSSPYRKNAEEIAGKSIIDLSRAYDAYWNKDYENARVMITDFVTSNPAHTRVDELLYRKADCLYQMDRHDEFMTESEALLNQKPDRKYADVLLYLQSAVYVKKGEGARARVILDNLQSNFPDSQEKDNFDQMRLESYLYYRNKITDITDTQAELPVIENLLDLCFHKAIENDNRIIFEKNIFLADKYFAQTNQIEKHISFFKGIHDEFSDTKWSFSLKEKILDSLINGKIYSEAQTLGKLYLSEDSLDLDQKRKISKIVIRAYVLDNKEQEAVKIYEQYN